MNRCHEKSEKSCQAMRVIPRILLLLLLVLVAHSATMAQRRCWVETLTPVSFGNYDPVQTSDLDATGQFRFHCAGNYSAIVSIDAGTGGSFAPRTMQGPVNQLGYNLYLDASRTTVWGDGTGGTSVASYNNVRTWTTVPVYGRVPFGQSVGSGAYTDTVVITIEW